MKNLSFREHLWWMNLALEEAEKAYRIEEVPIGAILVDEEGKEIARSYNLKEQTANPCGHAEILAITQAAQTLNSWRLLNCTLYVTLEPCPMCLGAMVQSRIGQLVFGAYDPKGGALSLGFNLYKDERLNHHFRVMGGVRHFQCSRILSQFFREKRQDYRKKRHLGMGY